MTPAQPHRRALRRTPTDRQDAAMLTPTRRNRCTLTPSRLGLRRVALLTALSAAILAPALRAQDAVILRGGWVFTATSDTMVRNRGIFVRGGKLLVVSGDLSEEDTTGARVVQLRDDEYILPGIFDMHAHYNMTLGEGGIRQDEYTYNPLIFLANGVTSTFPAGEYDPEGMEEARKRIDSGEQIGPRIYNSGPYFGTARRGWNQQATAADIEREVDHWAAEGVRSFKAKGISPEHLRVLITRAHLHGLTVTAHLESGFRNSTNAKAAILMGIDRVEHILGGDELSPDRPAYASWIHADTSSPEVKDIIHLFVSHHVIFDPTITAPVYFTTVADKPGFDYWVDERQFFTPYVQAWVKRQPPRKPFPLFDSLYYAMLRTTKALYDAGGTLTLGTDNPSRGEYLAGFSAHRELHALVLAGIPPAAALRIATINGARALGVGTQLGTIETGKLADLLVVRGNPLEDIRNTRHVQLVMKSGTIYDPKALLAMAVGKIGPTGPQHPAAEGGAHR
ncbi:MAG: amidohydrolase family protein [Gemmatimonadaceae bacterium]|nr:amidohydrolase family protein [Gemmatimonadaceae bacterium]